MLVYSVVVRMIDVFVNECCGMGHVSLPSQYSAGQYDEFYTLIILTQMKRSTLAKLANSKCHSGEAWGIFGA